MRCVCKLLFQHLSEDEVISVLQTPPAIGEEEGKIVNSFILYGACMVCTYFVVLYIYI